MGNSDQLQKQRHMFLSPQRENNSTAMGAAGHLPGGEVGIWMFIGGDMMIFSLFFIVVIREIGLDPETFHASQAHLNQSFAAINTVFLLTSSWFVANAVEAARGKKKHISLACLVAAIVCGLGFCVIKYFEYHEKFSSGITLDTNMFYTYYFMFTFIHLFHVLIGLVVLAFMVRISWKGVFDLKRISFLEGGASYWHMVDLLWIALFAFLYLVK